MRTIKSRTFTCTKMRTWRGAQTRCQDADKKNARKVQVLRARELKKLEKYSNLVGESIYWPIFCLTNSIKRHCCTSISQNNRLYRMMQADVFVGNFFALKHSRKARKLESASTISKFHNDTQSVLFAAGIVCELFISSMTPLANRIPIISNHITEVALRESIIL